MCKSGDNIGLVWKKIHMSKKCQFEDTTTINWYFLLDYYGIPIFHT